LRAAPDGGAELWLVFYLAVAAVAAVAVWAWAIGQGFLTRW
jgi:hypothetical protein